MMMYIIFRTVNGCIECSAGARVFTIRQNHCLSFMHYRLA